MLYQPPGTATDADMADIFDEGFVERDPGFQAMQRAWDALQSHEAECAWDWSAGACPTHVALSRWGQAS